MEKKIESNDSLLLGPIIVALKISNSTSKDKFGSI